MVYDSTLLEIGKGDINLNSLTPGVYEIKEVSKDTKSPSQTRTFELVPYDKLVKGRLTIPPVIYGDIMDFIKIGWNMYAISEKSEGMFLFGNSGQGKSDASSIMGNISLNHKIPVIIVQSLNGDMDLVKYIDKLPDACIVFEEFGKMFNYYIQNKMLSLFSATGIKRLYIINDNDKNGISPFLLNRPGRITLKKEFGKLPIEVFEKYIDDHGVKKDTLFHDDMMKMFKTTTVLSMDHVKYIIKMHLQYPNFDLKYILSILNVDVLTKPVLYRIVEVKKVSDGSLFRVSRSTEIEKSQFDNGRDYYLTLDKIVEEVSTTDEAKTNPQPQQGMMGGMGYGGGYNPKDKLMSFRLTNTRLIDSNKVFAKFEIIHNDEKYHVTLVVEDE